MRLLVNSNTRHGTNMVIRRSMLIRERAMRFRRLTVVAVSAVVVSCGTEAPVRQPPEVTVARPVTGEVMPYVDFTGSTRAVESAEIRARVGGVLEQQLFQPTEIVDEGQVLFVIQQDQYAAARAEADASLRSAIADSALKESNLERIQIAIETNAVSRQDLDRAQAERDAAIAAVLGARARLSRAQLDFDYTQVRSPIAGQVGRRQVDPGNLVGFTEQTLLTTVNRIRPIHVYFNAPEWVVLEILRQMDDLRPDTAERDRIPGGADRVARVLVGTAADEDRFPFEGELDFVGNTVDPGTGTIEMRAVFENEDLQLFPGLFVRVRVMAVQSTEALLVEEQAIGTDLGGKYLYLVGEGDIVEQRYVRPGQLQPDGTVVIEEGLDGTETYISNGLLRARPGLPVTPRTQEEMARQKAAVQAEVDAEPEIDGDPGEKE